MYVKSDSQTSAVVRVEPYGFSPLLSPLQETSTLWSLHFVRSGEEPTSVMMFGGRLLLHNEGNGEIAPATEKAPSLLPIWQAILDSTSEVMIAHNGFNVSRKTRTDRLQLVLRHLGIL